MRSWLSDLVGPRLREIVTGAADNDDAAAEPACERCGHTASRERWRAVRQVCSVCGYHRPLPVDERLALLFAGGSDQVIELPATPADPLKFRDHRRYTDRLREAAEKSGRPEAVTVAHGRIGDEPAVVAVIDPAFLDGTIGAAVGDALLAAGRLAVIQEATLVLVAAPCGLRLQEGMVALAQIDRIAVAIDDARRVGLPCLAILPAGATGTVAATIAALADLVIAEPDALSPPTATDPAADPEAEPATDPTADPAAATAPAVAEAGVADPAPVPGRLPADLVVDRLPADLVVDRLPADLVVDRLALPGVLARLVRLIRRPRPSAEVLPLLPAEPLAFGSLDDVSAALAERRNRP